MIIVGLLRSFGRLQCIMTIWDRAIDRLIVEQIIRQIINLRQIVKGLQEWIDMECGVRKEKYEVRPMNRSMS